MIGLGLGLELGLEQKLTPQQVQYLKLLQLTGLELEQYIARELEMNPMLEEDVGSSDIGDDTEFTSVETLPEDAPHSDSNGSDDATPEDSPISVDAQEEQPFEVFNPESGAHDEEQTWIDFIEDEADTAKYSSDDDDDEGFPLPASRSVLDDIEDQLRLLDLTEEEQMIGEEILGSIEPSGYLYRDVADIALAVNEKIDALNLLRRQEALHGAAHTNGRYYMRDYMDMYRGQYDEDFEHQDLSPIRKTPSGVSQDTMRVLQHVTPNIVESVLLQIQRLEPPGVGARNLRECLLAQLYALPKRNAAQQLAVLVLEKTYDAFRMKHYEVIMRELRVSDVYLREALKAIRALNPKPGGMESHATTSSIIPDFLVFYDEDKNDFVIQLNDARVPAIRVNRMYEQMKNHVRELTQRGMKSQRMNKDTRKFLKQKYDDAKFLILALKQRRHTMIRVMTAIVHRQREFFLRGKHYLRPLIYKDIAEDTGVDISTVCRVVNNKYAQTDFGVYELRYFFSEGLPMPKELSVHAVSSDSNTRTALAGGEESDNEISTRVIKEKLKEIIAAEPKNKPFSDDKLVQELAKAGFTIARRTVAKYRDLAGIPPARLRREL
ncbi:MAG: RNA polymerase factor sigma-54 [Bacteroidota bacterium]|nr:RNA polymerase factor sigma-54 [Candidatus Kapabacteria bacterium]MDW8220533.1 RNA polymerase factor sigma-54 [Bacteroidota bacterium]